MGDQSVQVISELGKAQGSYSGDGTLFVTKRKSVSRRRAFTQNEYNRIIQVMNGDGWLKVGKHQNDRRLERYRQMLRAYVIFMANTGLRVGEARNLRWKDISFATNGAGHEICKVWVSQTHSKVKKRREVIATSEAARAIKELHSIRKGMNDYCTDDDLIWCNEQGRNIKDFREGFNHLLVMADAELDSDRNKHTIYCLRHFYITERLREGVAIYEIASNCGTSVDMIERYYSDARAADFTDRLTGQN